MRCTDPTDPAVVAATIIDGTGFFHVVQCISGEGPFTVLNGFTITGGNATGLHPDNAGGGMYNISDSSPTVANCTFSGNSAALNGGGMYNTLLSSPTVTDCTFSGNDATDDGGGMYNNNNNSNPTVTNCILWGDTAVGSGNEIFNDGTSGPMISFSDIEGSGGSAAWDASVGTDGGDNIDADPLFVNEPGGDLRLSAGSPAIDAADNTAVPEGITTDLDGNPRFIDDPATVDTGDGVCHVDIGAYEFQDGAVVCFPGDINGDGAVSVPDLLILLAAWGPCPAPCPPSCPADIDSDCAVSVPDLLILLANWG